jgi:uncharacterized protein (TIGR03382 family)
MSKRWFGVAAFVVSTFVARTGSADVVVTVPPFTLGNAIVGDGAGTTGSRNINDPANSTNVDLELDSGDPDCSLFELTSDVTDRAVPFGVNVKYTPVSRGTRTCTVLAFSTVGRGPRGSFDVTATGIGPHLLLPSSVPIGDVRVLGNATGTAMLRVTNDGDIGGGNLIISSITPNGAGVTIGTIPTTTLATGAFTDVPVFFDPGIAGTFSVAIVVLTNGTPQASQVANVMGRGTLAELAVDDPTFGATNVVERGSSATTNITITNTATTNAGVLSVSGASITPASTWFSFAAAQGCAAGAQNCTFDFNDGPMQVTDTPATVAIVCSPPNDAVGSQMATVTFTSDTDTASDVTSTLMCRVEGQPASDAGVDDGGPGEDGGGSNALTNPYANRGCSTSGGGAGLVVLAPMLLVLRRRRRT